MIIDGSLYEWILGYPSMDFIFHRYMELTYIEAVRRGIIVEKIFFF